MKSEDIARLAGVSRSTVSRVINNYPNVPEKTREKIMHIIEEYHYEPNTSARVLAGKGTNTLGLFVVSIADRSTANRIYQNNYFSPFIDAVVDTANARDFYVLIHTIYKKRDYQKVRQAFQQKRIDGGILIGTEKDMSMVLELSKMGFPFAVIDYDANKIPGKNINSQLCLINPMDYAGTENVMKYLIDSGHKRIGIITGRMSTYSGRQRYMAYQDMMNKNGLIINPDHVLNGNFIKKTAYKEVERLVSSGNLPTALLSCSDDMAFAAMEVFDRHNIRVPDDISLTGFDDTPISPMMKPSLTTVRVPIYDMAQKAVETVISMFEEKNMTFSTLHFPTELIIRKSCKNFNYIS